jgi:replication factor A1
MRNKVSEGEYLAFLSAKYEVDPDKLFYGLISAEEDQKSICGNLSIECRGSLERKSNIFLLTNGPKVVAQFSIPKEFLLEKTNPIKNLRKSAMLHRRLASRNIESRPFHIEDLRIGMKKIDLRAKVLEVAKPTLVFTRFGNHASVANALIGDETGTIKLCLWNQQIDAISVGNVIRVENGNVSAFRGEKQLRIGKKGKLSNVEALNHVCAKVSCHL